MFRARFVAVPVACLALLASSVGAQDMSRYRGFQLGMTLAAVAERARLAPTAAQVLHQRPQLIQQLEWYPQIQPQQGEAAGVEAVRVVRFAFYDGRLFSVTVAYDRNRVEGLTADDFIQAISESYGTAVLQSTRLGSVPPRQDEDISLGSDRTVAAQWEDRQNAATLVHTTYPSAFELLLVAREPDRLARAAILASTQLDRLEAPQRETDRQQKQADDSRASIEKARAANKPGFRF
jgi:hypothetical protein